MHAIDRPAPDANARYIRERKRHGFHVLEIPPDLPIKLINDLDDLFPNRGDISGMAERVEMSRRNIVVDGKVYSVKRQNEPVFLLRLSDLSARYLVVTADAIDFHGFERLVWPINAEQISVFEKLDEASAYFLKLTSASGA